MNALGFELLRPSELGWLALVVPVACLGIWALARRRAELATLVSPRRILRFAPGLSWSRSRARLALAVAALVCLAFAAAGPVRGHTLRPVQRKGLDLVVCLDTSRSMLARDVKPDRLTRARREIGALIDNLRGDRVALVAFSGEPREVAPLTHDRVTLERLLERTTPDENTLGGTDLGAALTRALGAFESGSSAHQVILLVTDGEDLGGRGLAVAKEAADQGIRIFVVGLGTAQGSKIPVLDAQGRESFVRDPQGKEVVSLLGGESLAAIATTSGGDYLSSADSPTPLEDLYRERISKLEGREFEGGEQRVPHDRFQWFLALALACWCAELALAGNRSSGSAAGARP